MSAGVRLALETIDAAAQAQNGLEDMMSDKYKGKTIILSELSEDELAEWNATIDASTLPPTEREIRVGAVDRFHKGPFHWQRTA